jgi:hypothetical protein
VHFSRLTQNNNAYVIHLNFTSFESNLVSLLFKTRKHKTWKYCVHGEGVYSVQNVPLHARHGLYMHFVKIISTLTPLSCATVHKHVTALEIVDALEK